jgi:TonB family protein
MRVLVVDQDSTLLTAITQTLGEYFSIDAVTNKADCLDLVRLNAFDVIVAGERLEDGSGLELLGQLARSRPDMLRIFSAERERLKLLKGRLGPFGLFRTLAYPIQARQLLAALSAAAGIEEEVEATAEAAAPETVESETAGRPQPTLSPVARAQPPAPPRPTASAPSRTSAQNFRGGQPAGASNDAPARQAPTSNANARARTTVTSVASRQVPRQPTPAALASASKLAIVNRPKGFPPPSEITSHRSAFVVGAGVVLVLGGLALSFKIFNTKDEPVSVATNSSAIRSPRFPPEVVKLVADTEVAFQQDNVKTARTDVAALQQIAPDHPRLPFFESLLKRLEATQAGGAKSAVSRIFSRHTSPPETPSTSGASAQRRQPDGTRDTASAATPMSASAQPSLTQTASSTVSTFSGRTLEDSNAGNQPGATPSQAMATPVPRRPGSGASAASVLGATQEPRLIQHVAAEYPPEAARAGIEGAVDVSFTVSPEGKVSDVSVSRAFPSDIFNRAAMAAVRRWKYEPKIVDGTPVEAQVQLRVQFKLDPHAH